jgi:hypothetical protein
MFLMQPVTSPHTQKKSVGLWRSHLWSGLTLSPWEQLLKEVTETPGSCPIFQSWWLRVSVLYLSLQ